MLGALGFFVATVLWLLLLPAISRRADRLARRRAELMFPMSVDEISAERDHLRAEFAVRQRELERRAEEHQIARSAALVAVGRLDMQVSELKTTLGVRDIKILDLDNDLSSTGAELADTQGRLAAEEVAHAASRDELSIRNQTLVERERDIASLRIERADLSATLAARVRDLGEANAAIAQLSADLQRTSTALSSLRIEHATLESEKSRLAAALDQSEALASVRAVQISVLEQRLDVVEAQLSNERSGHTTTRAAFEQRGAELGALSAERESLRQRLKASDDAATRLDQALTELRSAKATSDVGHAASRKEVIKISELLRKSTQYTARVEAEAASFRRERDVQIEALQADLATAREGAASSRGERSALKQELTQLHRDAERTSLRLDAENAKLRAEILRVADQFLKLRAVGKRPAVEQDKGAPAVVASEAATDPAMRLKPHVSASKRGAAPPRERPAQRLKTAAPPVPDTAAE